MSRTVLRFRLTSLIFWAYVGETARVTSGPDRTNREQSDSVDPIIHQRSHPHRFSKIPCPAGPRMLGTSPRRPRAHKGPSRNRVRHGTHFSTPPPPLSPHPASHLASRPIYIGPAIPTPRNQRRAAHHGLPRDSSSGVIPSRTDPLRSPRLPQEESREKDAMGPQPSTGPVVHRRVPSQAVTRGGSTGVPTPPGLPAARVRRATWD